MQGSNSLSLVVHFGESTCVVTILIYSLSFVLLSRKVYKLFLENTKSNISIRQRYNCFPIRLQNKKENYAILIYGSRMITTKRLGSTVTRWRTASWKLLSFKLTRVAIIRHLNVIGTFVTIITISISYAAFLLPTLKM